jgi:hypothetical protein
LTFSSTRTWTIVVVAMTTPFQSIELHCISNSMGADLRYWRSWSPAFCHPVPIAEEGTSCTPVGIQHRITAPAPHLLDVLLRIRRIRESVDHINDGKSPLFVMPSAPDGSFLKHGDVIFWCWSFGNWPTLADWFSGKAQRVITSRHGFWQKQRVHRSSCLGRSERQFYAPSVEFSRSPGERELAA